MFKDAVHMSLGSQQALLWETVEANEALMRLVEALPPGAWVGSGVIFQNVWNALEGLAWNTHVKDADVLFFDAEDMTGASEARVRAEIGAQALEVDVVNVARIHTWYPEVFGLTIPAYQSIAESLTTWPTFGSAVAVRRVEGVWELMAPFGLHDMFAGWVRPNPVMVEAHIYEAKAARWKSCWPWLRVWPWAPERS